MKNLKFTLKAWPVIALATIGLCYLTQLVASWCGIELKEQQNVDLIRQMAGWNARFVFNCALVIVIMPMIEEAIFRGLLTRLPIKTLSPRLPLSVIRSFGYSVIALSSALFSAAHYFAQPWPDNAFLALFFFGLAQCWLYKKTNIWCAMLNHGLFNATNLVLLFLLPAE